ncbi:MAG TPA: endonuclease MutS2 [Longimicrobiales bacterium]|nr:endonuclease MutS2 [Longimicrobiales bacterium]
MNRHALDVVQFPEALAVVARYASGALGAAAVRALEPLDARAAASDELARVDQFAGFLVRAAEWYLGPVPDLHAALRRLAIAGTVLEPLTLRDTGTLLRTSRIARASLGSIGTEHPLLQPLHDRLVARPALEEALRDAIDDAGEVRDTASRELSRLRRELRSLRTRMVERLERYMASLPERFQVQGASVSLREGRYVIPVRREGRGEVGGIVHDESATGSTLFVEPPLALELMNQLRALEIAEHREVQRILRELTERLRAHHEELADALDALIAIDSLQARARYALASGGHRPDLLPAGAREYHVVQGRHPLLLASAEPVVPFDLELSDGERTLLVSGPNTGGKTVLLKAVGLISALAQSGVIPPVGAGTRLPVFRDMFADIGDEQSIEASLSTFSAHLRNLREILDNARPDTLVLIDEMGSGTDPAEGGALARALLLELTRRSVLTIATTHLGQLKLLAGEEPGIVNASLQFDASELRPTYRLLKGIPGRSYGLAIARRLGFPATLLERAEASLSGVERDAGHLLVELEAKDRELGEALAAMAQARSEAEGLRQQLEERVAAVRRREQTAERRARQQARDLLRNARQEVEAAIREVREAARSGDRAAVENAARTARRRIEEEAREQDARAPREEPAPGRGGPVAVGDRVRIAASGSEGVLVELRDGRAVVEVSGVRMQLPAAALERSPAQAAAARPGSRGGWSAPDFEASPEVDLRGLRVDELVPRLQQAIDNAVQAALPSLRIIHGKGTGALREAVIEIVGADPRVRGHRPGGVGEGGAGVTIAELR